jgi:hypothetical protein
MLVSISITADLLAPTKALMEKGEIEKGNKQSTSNQKQAKQPLESGQ